MGSSLDQDMASGLLASTAVHSFGAEHGPRPRRVHLRDGSGFGPLTPAESRAPGCFHKLGVHSFGPLITKALFFGSTLYPDVWKLPSSVKGQG